MRAKKNWYIQIEMMTRELEWERESPMVVTEEARERERNTIETNMYTRDTKKENKKSTHRIRITH